MHLFSFTFGFLASSLVSLHFSSTHPRLLREWASARTAVWRGGSIFTRKEPAR